MANTIKIKRGSDANVPTSGMSAGEPLFSTDLSKLYVATDATTKSWIGAPIKDEDNMSSDSATSLATQQSIKAYVDSQVTAQDLDFSTDSGVGAVDLDSQTMAFTGGEGIDLTHSAQSITVAGEDASDSNKGIASFNSSDFSTSSGAVSIKTGGVSNGQLAGSIANSKLANSTVTVAGDSGSNAVDLGDTLTVQGTANEVETSVSGDTVTIGLPNDVTISGDLTVNGTTTTIESSTLTVEDPLIKLSKDNAADSVDIGLYGKYVEASTTKYTGMFSDQDNSHVFTFFKGAQSEPGSTVDTSASNTGYSLVGIKCASVDAATIDGGTF